MTAAAAPATAPATARYAGRCFIVVDDNEVNRVVLERMLSREGAQVQAFEDGPAAVLWCAQNPGLAVDAVVIDRRMPLMDGAQTLAALRVALHPRPVRAVAVSAALTQSDGLEEEAASLAEGFDAFLPKPVDPQALRDALAATAGTPATTQATTPATTSASATTSPATPRSAAASSATSRTMSRNISQVAPLLLSGLRVLSPAAWSTSRWDRLDDDLSAEDRLWEQLQAAAAAHAPLDAAPVSHAASDAALAASGSAPATVCRLIYRSHGRISDEQGNALLGEAQSRNLRAGITGVLIHDGERFVQVIEGGERDVDALFQRIRHDSRHRDVQVLELALDQPRLFGAWTMASARLDRRQFDLLMRHLEQRQGARA